jgi:hypothetical protein
MQRLSVTAAACNYTLSTTLSVKRNVQSQRLRLASDLNPQALTLSVSVKVRLASVSVKVRL